MTDLIVIGGGSGGLAAAKEASRCGAQNVILFDYVKPTEPHGTTWGLGGTCVNVGCVPKKLMHYAALCGPIMHHDAPQTGWTSSSSSTHDWEKIQAYIKGLNFSYRVGLRKAGVQYINALARIEGPNEVSYIDRKGQACHLKAKNILIAVGGRPHIPEDVTGAAENALTSDDLFSYKKAPGKTLVVGASYIGLECAGFLKELGFSTTVAVRSILLRGFDRQCSEKIGSMMKEMGVKFIASLPKSIERRLDGQLEVSFADENLPREIFDTVFYATGRKADTASLNLNTIGSILSVHVVSGITTDNNGKISAINEQTKVPSIFVVGDALKGGIELTPVAIKAGEFLARRLFGGSTKFMDWDFIPTTVFTPIEYGCVGLSEEAAVAKYGAEDVEVFLSEFNSLEMAWVHRPKDPSLRKDDLDTDLSPSSLAKLVCLKSLNLKVVGFHFVGRNAGELTQGYALALRLGANKNDFDDTIGIHPTDAEVFHSLSITKSSGESWVAAGGCGGGKCG